MFRLVDYSNPENDDKDKVAYISMIASEMLIEYFEYIFDDPIDVDEIYQVYFAEKDFFNGFGQYLGMSDDEAGQLYLLKKVDHILEQLRDEEIYYTFDIFEEYLLYIVTQEMELRASQIKGFKKELAKIDKVQEVSEYLMKNFGYARTSATKLSKQLLNILKVYPKDDDDNMFFWDKDFHFIFAKGFIEGINITKSYAGKNMGYGYDYACEMFTNIGLKPPIMLLGTKEAHDIMYEVEEQKIRGAINGIFDIGGEKSEGNADDDIPFN